MESKGRGRPRKYATEEEAKEAHLEKIKAYNKTQKHKEYQAQYYQKRKAELEEFRKYKQNTLPPPNPITYPTHIALLPQINKINSPPINSPPPRLIQYNLDSNGIHWQGSTPLLYKTPTQLPMIHMMSL